MGACATKFRGVKGDADDAPAPVQETVSRDIVFTEPALEESVVPVTAKDEAVVAEAVEKEEVLVPVTATEKKEDDEKFAVATEAEAEPELDPRKSLSHLLKEEKEDKVSIKVTVESELSIPEVSSETVKASEQSEQKAPEVEVKLPAPEEASKPEKTSEEDTLKAPVVEKEPSKPDESLKTEMPKLEVPEEKSTTVETLKVEVPEEKKTIVETPKLEVPEEKLTTVETPKVEVPEVKVTTLETPKLEVPEEKKTVATDDVKSVTEPAL